MKLGVHRPDSGTYELRPSPATCLHLRRIRAFGVPSTGDEHGPPEQYVTFTLLEADPMAPQPSARTEALSHADQCDPLWHDDLRVMLALVQSAATEQWVAIDAVDPTASCAAYPCGGAVRAQASQ